jgi:hypothetical protein
LVLGHRGIEGYGAQRVGAEEEVRGGRLQELLDGVAGTSFAGGLEEAGLGELADVISDSLPRGEEGAGGAGGRS